MTPAALVRQGLTLGKGKDVEEQNSPAVAEAAAEVAAGAAAGVLLMSALMRQALPLALALAPLQAACQSTRYQKRRCCAMEAGGSPPQP